MIQMLAKIKHIFGAATNVSSAEMESASSGDSGSQVAALMSTDIVRLDDNQSPNLITECDETKGFEVIPVSDATPFTTNTEKAADIPVSTPLSKQYEKITESYVENMVVKNELQSNFTIMNCVVNNNDVSKKQGSMLQDEGSGVYPHKIHHEIDSSLKIIEGRRNFCDENKMKMYCLTQETSNFLNLTKSSSEGEQNQGMNLEEIVTEPSVVTNQCGDLEKNCIPKTLVSNTCTKINTDQLHCLEPNEDATRSCTDLELQIEKDCETPSADKINVEAKPSPQLHRSESRQTEMSVVEILNSSASRQLCVQSDAISPSLFDSISIQFEDDFPISCGNKEKMTSLKRKRCIESEPMEDICHQPKQMPADTQVWDPPSAEQPVPNSNKKVRRKRRSSNFTGLDASAIIQSPTLNEDELKALSTLPNARRSSRLRRKSLVLYRAELKKNIEEDSREAAKNSVENTDNEVSLISDDHGKDLNHEDKEDKALSVETKEDVPVCEPIEAKASGDVTMVTETKNEDAEVTRPKRRSKNKVNQESTESRGSESKVTTKAKRGRKPQNKNTDDSDAHVKDIYLNKLWKSQMPTQKSWETIYEEPRKVSGVESYVGKSKQKRFLNMEETNLAKLKKRRVKAAKRGWKRRTKMVQDANDQKLGQILKELDD